MALVVVCLHPAVVHRDELGPIFCARAKCQSAILCWMLKVVSMYDSATAFLALSLLFGDVQRLVDRERLVCSEDRTAIGDDSLQRAVALHRRVEDAKVSGCVLADRDTALESIALL